MMIKRIHTISAAVLAAVAAGGMTTSLVSAQGYPPPGAVYSPYPPGGVPAEYRRGPRPADFDALDEDDAPGGPGSTALSPPDRCFRPKIRAMAGRWALALFIPTKAP
jgi:hypothetical protein